MNDEVNVCMCVHVDNNCRIIRNLTFCTTVAYAVPSNPLTHPSRSDLASFYDGLAAARYKNFTYALAQIPCETTASAQWSLARTCDDCAAAYKTWLCHVTIPRCQDLSSPNNPFWKIRNLGQPFYNSTSFASSFLPSMNSLSSFSSSSSSNGNQTNNNTDGDGWNSIQFNTSRLTSVDTVVKPGPYKEILPCISLCHDLLANCPAALQFSCPDRDSLPALVAYGDLNLSHISGGGALRCNYPGALSSDLIPFILPSSSSGSSSASASVSLYASSTFSSSFLLLPHFSFPLLLFFFVFFDPLHSFF